MEKWNGWKSCRSRTEGKERYGWRERDMWKGGGRVWRDVRMIRVSGRVEGRRKELRKVILCMQRRRRKKRRRRKRRRRRRRKRRALPRSAPKWTRLCSWFPVLLLDI